MKIKILFSAITAYIIIACNNSSDSKTADSKDSAGHEADHHPVITSSVPDTENPPPGAKVSFRNLKTGQTIASPFKIEMGVEGMKIDTAGPLVSGSGHHHLIIDGADSLTKGIVVAKDSVNIHFGKGQTEYELKLKPGKHKLTLQFADGLHRSYGSQMAAKIEVNVKQ
jgi:hypothetical protein